MDVENLLLSLAYCWHLTPEQIHRLHFRERSLKTVKNRLTALRADNLIEPVGWTDANGRRQGSMWQLTNQGHKEIAAHPAYPGMPRQRSSKLFRHDVRLLEMVVRNIELARQSGLCGIKVYREIRLNPDPKARKPILDGLMVMEVGGTFAADQPNLVPWSLARPLDDETLWRVALEADNDTESAQVIADKATNYQTVMADDAWWAYWSERFGPSLPCVQWVAPSSERADQIARLWEQRWPKGRWMVADDAGLAANQWHLHWAEPTRIAQINWPEKAKAAKPKTAASSTATSSTATTATATAAATTAVVAAPAPRVGAAVAQAITSKPDIPFSAEVPDMRMEPGEHILDFMARVDHAIAQQDAAREAQPPRPLAELIKILPWDKYRSARFDASGRNILSGGGVFSTAQSSTKPSRRPGASTRSRRWSAIVPMRSCGAKRKSADATRQTKRHGKRPASSARSAKRRRPFAKGLSRSRTGRFAW